MKIVFHEKYFDVYSGDPASAKGGLDGSYRILKEEFEFVRPTAEDLQEPAIHLCSNLGSRSRLVLGKVVSAVFSGRYPYYFLGVLLNLGGLNGGEDHCGWLWWSRNHPYGQTTSSCRPS
jgi:hypothetical protein